MKRTLVENIDWLYSGRAAQGEPLRDAWLLVDDGRIEALGAGPAPRVEADRLDLAGHVVVPGFINLHHHFFQSLTRAVAGAMKSSVLDWLLTMYPVWERLTPGDLAAATRLAAAELLLSGCTTSVDHSYLVPAGEREYLDAEIAAARAMGMRLHLVVGFAPTLEGDLATRLRPLMGDRVDRLVFDEATVLDQMEEAARRHQDASEGAWCRVALGPTGATYESAPFMRRIADAARAHGCGLHTHLHPREDEREKAKRLLDTTPVEFLAASDWLRPGTWFAHCSQLEAHEMQRFADQGVGIAHCPRTIARLGFPLTPISAMRAHGVAVGIGVDGAASNDSGSMLTDLRLALVMHRIGTPAGTDPRVAWIDPIELLEMATCTAAQVIGRNDLGALEIGKRADLAAFDMLRIDFAGALTDPLGAIFMAGSSNRADLTMVEGRIIVRDGRLTRASEREIVEQANASSRAMFRAAGRGELLRA